MQTRRQAFLNFYKRQSKAPSRHDQQNAISKSVERLIDHGFLVGFGRRTPEKWYIERVKLTSLGRRKARSLLGQQQRIPFK
jgi:hypothetical protein